MKKQIFICGKCKKQYKRMGNWARHVYRLVDKGDQAHWTGFLIKWV